jgi:hypothetical protein
MPDLPAVPFHNIAPHCKLSRALLPRAGPGGEGGTLALTSLLPQISGACSIPIAVMTQLRAERCCDARETE